MFSIDADQRTIIFICGLHRSGTSLLHELLKKHPDISGFSNTGVPKDEGQHLQSIYPPAKVFGGPGRFGFDPASFMDEHHPLVSEENARKLFDEWSHHWDLSKSNFVEKSPPNLVRMPFLQALFPKAKFVTILRHPVAVAYATKAKFHKKGKIDELIEHWIVCHQRFLDDLPRIKNHYFLRYEDLASDYQVEVSKIFQFLGIQEVSLSEEVSSTENLKYFEKWNVEREEILQSTRFDIQQWEKWAKAFSYSLDS
ncbi:sulfotransferase [Leptolyngbya sp. CCY15150]|uniref:sulfotransferase family protein n=1 Tax=Leptolyngbya sp. CCY15150 TaxID=2767772 RepID=UPI00194ED689|nr:sulfotransferase [Leptolyngbya sp. CCY15150]